MKILSRDTAFSTPWFSLTAKRVDAVPDPGPFYSLKTGDYVSVVALTAEDQVVLVRQYRPAVERFTLEFPSGHVDAGESPEQSASRELHEETGFSAGPLRTLGTLLTDTGRMENRSWCFLALGVKRDPLWAGPETGVEPVLVPLERLFDLIHSGEFAHALHLAPLLLAVLKDGRFSAQSVASLKK